MGWINYAFWKSIKNLRNYWSGNGVDSYIQLAETKVFAGDFEVTTSLKTTDASDFAISDGNVTGGEDGLLVVYVDNPDGLEVIIVKSSGFDRYLFGGQSEIINGEDNVVTINVVDYVMTAYINGVQVGAAEAITERAHSVSTLFGGSSRYMNGIAYNTYLTDLTTPLNSAFIPINNGWADNPDITDDDGNVVAAVINGQEDDWSVGEAV